MVDPRRAMLRRAALLICGCAAAWARVNAQDAERTRRRSVTVRDAIEMTKIGDPGYFAGGPSAGRVAQFSPDGERFVVVLRKGDVARNVNEFSILLWRTREVFRRPKPDTVLTMASSSNRPAISDVRWFSDDETIAFIGAEPGDARQLYTLDLRTRALTQVTRSASDVVAYSVSPTGHAYAYTVEVSPDDLWNATTVRDGVVVTTQWLSMLIAGKQRSGWQNDAELFFLANVQRGQSAMPLARVPNGIGSPSLSPDESKIVIDMQVDSYPAAWKDYSVPILHEWTRQPLLAGQHSFIRRYLLIDAKTGASRVLLDAPVLGEPAVTWAADSKSVVIANTYLPLGNTKGAERDARQSRTFTVEVAVPSGDVMRIDTVGVTSAERRSPRRPELVLMENMDDPPKIVAVDSTTRQRAMLLDLNPQFQHLRFARIEEIEWKGSDDHPVKGGLYYPVDYVTGKRYPLVIQTHLWRSDRFWIDGPWTTAFAAQPLAGKDIMVLQADESEADWDTMKELRREVATFEGAIDELDRRGLIDREQVGIIGFSRTGEFVADALAFSRYHFAAAAVQDGVDGGYFSYMAVLNANPSVYDTELINGAAPFGDGLKAWMQVSPAFNLDRVQTPLRLLAPSNESLLGQWAWFVGLRRLGKPVEMVLMRDAKHVLERPAERMISQGGDVDWFAFWLKGEEDPDPAKTEQYTRWRGLRALRDSNATKAASTQGQ